MRLKLMASGSRFSLICEAAQEARILKVVAYADGRMVDRQVREDGIVFVVEKT